MKPKEKLPSPSIEEVKRYLLLWDELNNYRVQEEALSALFRQYPGNTEKEKVGVLLKVVALNHFYSTNIFNVYVVAKRIMRIPGFDERLRGGESSIIGELRNAAWQRLVPQSVSGAVKRCGRLEENRR